MLIIRGTIKLFDQSSVSSSNGINLFVGSSPTKPKTQHVSSSILMINSAQAESVPAKESSNVPESLI